MQIYNSLSQKKETFTPLTDKHVSMYVCGITPYDAAHFGHAFTYIFFDTFQRYLTYKGYTIIYTQNVTDIDDDMLRKAKETGKNWKDLGLYWTDKFLKEMKALNISTPTYYVKATETIPTMIEMIEHFQKKGLAYERNGNVYFRIQKDKEYGQLSHYDRKQMLLLSKERGGNPDDPLKEDPLDFILWQKSKPDEPFWDSPWGRGRPGWHIECSAMVYKHLGKQIVVHGGGRDLIYPHHESEIAQSENFTGLISFVKYWIHTGAVMYQGEKMSKSLGNLVMVSDLLKKYSANAVRYLFLSHHYRFPWEFQESELEEVEKNMKKILWALQTPLSKNIQHKTNHALSIANKRYMQQFSNYMDDDLNTPKALSLLEEMSNKIIQEQANIQTALHTIFRILGFTA